MRLSQLITEVGYEVDRTSIDDRVKYWIQQSVDVLYGAVPRRERERVATLTTVNAQKWLNVPTDYGDYESVYNAANEKLTYVPPLKFFAKNQVMTSGTPEIFTFWNNQFLLAPIPDAVVVLTLNYLLEKPNIYVHNLTVEHQASMVGYVQVYIDEDGISAGEGKLLFVSPTTTDARILLQTVDGHQHEVIVYHDAAAASHPAWYFDETAANAWERNFFVSPTVADTVIKTENNRRHHHYLKFIHNPDPTAYPDGNNVEVYLDEDNNARDLRLAFISPTATDGTNELVHTAEGELPGFLERYQGVLHELAATRGHRFNRDYAWAKEHAQAASGLLSLITGAPNNLDERAEV